MDKLPMGGSGISMQTSTAKWQEDIDRTISDRMEIFVCR
jgi:membrane carboxypeptidase/penicillin-binding protein PbpC